MSKLFTVHNQPEIDDQEDTSSFLLSIGDLMSGLLMLFALLFITVQFQLNDRLSEVRRLKAELAEYKQAVDQLPVRILNAIEGKIGTGILEVDRETGDVTIGDRILFDEGSAELKPEGKQFLEYFIPLYSEAIFSSEKFEQQITRIVIEGNTSSKGTDPENMDLSLLRALSVTNYIFQMNFPHKARFKQKILAAGRGELDANQTDIPSDRKVAFRFQFRRQDFSKLFGDNLLQEGK